MLLGIILLRHWESAITIYAQDWRGTFHLAFIILTNFISPNRDSGRGHKILHFEELDETTRRWMLEMFLKEEAMTPYRDPSLSPMGMEAFAAEMERAIKLGSDDTLAESLADKKYWLEFEPSPSGGIMRTDPIKAASRLARTEFNVWYVRGLTRRLIMEGEEYCQIYRASDQTDKDTQCRLVENKVLRAKFVYDGHRAKERSGDPKAFSIPDGKDCYHTVRRLSPEMRAFIDLEKKKYKGFV